MRYMWESYHQAIKIHKRDEINNHRTIIADSAKHNKRDLWSELRKLDSVGKPAPTIIDSCTNVTNIANIFAKKYSDLYKSGPTLATEMAELRDAIARYIPCGSSSYLTARISVDDIVKTLSMLKKGKSDGLRGTDSDHLIQCSHRFKVYLSLMITSMSTHGFTPTGLLEAVITSIPKDLRGDLCSSDNYRGVSLCSALCKIVDLVVINKHRDKLFTSNLQFVFKPEHSTNMCTTILKEVASYYNSRKTDVYICMLDASKAFDRVHLANFSICCVLEIYHPYIYVYY